MCRASPDAKHPLNSKRATKVSISPPCSCATFARAYVLFRGITDSTITHGEGWEFIQLGRYLERTCAVSTLIRPHSRAGRASGVGRPAQVLHGLRGVLQGLHGGPVARARRRFSDPARSHEAVYETFIEYPVAFPSRDRKGVADIKCSTTFDTSPNSCTARP